MLLAIAALALSSALIIILCMGDPKRRRSSQQGGAAQGTALRRLLAFALVLPGIGLALTGDAAAFMVWLGGCAVAGWFVTLWFGRATPAP
jgi:hypothetical protein